MSKLNTPTFQDDDSNVHTAESVYHLFADSNNDNNELYLENTFHSPVAESALHDNK